ncbi:hypothetical protein [Streptomyces sp. NPDC127038]|uniref:hypothetical protein n=1 Tax=Streptomyces sp. NPDC127038 TaxID=3347114 RepID=UPI0036631FE2
MKVSQVPRGVWATAGVLAVAASTVGVPSERAVAAGAGLEVASGSGDYTLEFDPYTNFEPDAGGSVTLTNTGRTKITSYTLTVDYSSLGGVVDVRVPFPGCGKKTEGVLVCHGDDAPAPGKTTRLANFQLQSLKGAQGGTTGEIRVSGQADGTPITERVWKVDIEDKGYVQDRVTGEVKGKVKPGAEVHPGAGFTYLGPNTRKGTDFFMSAGHMSFEQEFSNCDYGMMPVYIYESGKRTDLAFPSAICHFDNTIAAGDSFDVSPGPLRIDDDARGAHWSGRLEDEDQFIDREKMTGVHRGKGPELKLVPRPDDAPPGKPQTTDLGVDYEVDNTTDIEALGASAEGRPGDVVTMDVGYRNNGPGGMPTWNGEEPIEELSVRTTVTIPPGTTAVRTPRGCRPLDDGKKPDGRSYDCANDVTDWWVGPGERLVWSFGLRIDKVSALKPGTVSLKVLPEHDSSTRNDTAAITVKAPGTPGGTGDTGSSSGTTGGSSGSGSGGGSGSGSGSTGGAHDPSSTSGQTGSMASTGAGPAPWIAGTAGVLAAGVGTVLLTTARRRRRS